MGKGGAVSGPRLSIIPARAATDRALKPRDLQVLCVLGRHTDDLGWCRKSQVKMADEMGCARSTVFEAIERLVKAGYVERHVQTEDNGRDSPHVYRVVLDPVHPKVSSVVDVDDPCRLDGTPADIPAPPAGPEAAPPAGPGPAPKNDPFRTTHQNDRERARDREDEKTVERWLRKVHPKWPSFVTDSAPKALTAAMALSDEDREVAAERMADYIAVAKVGGRTVICTFAVYLSERRWEKLPEATAVATKHVSREVRPFGPGWASLRFRALLDGPVELGDPDMTRAKREANYQASRQMLGAAKAEATYRSMGHEIGAGGELLFPDDFEERMWRAHVVANGYPEVNRLDKAASEGRSLPAPEGFDPVAQLMEAVPVGLQTWKAWQAEFERRHWPWLPSPGKQPVVFFPVGGPEGLAVFEQAIRDEGMGDDGGTRQAAE